MGNAMCWQAKFPNNLFDWPCPNRVCNEALPCPAAGPTLKSLCRSLCSTFHFQLSTFHLPIHLPHFVCRSANIYWFGQKRMPSGSGWYCLVSVDFTMDLWHSWGIQIVALVICVAILQTSASKNLSNFPGSLGYPHKHHPSHTTTHTHCEISLEFRRRWLRWYPAQWTVNNCQEENRICCIPCGCAIVPFMLLIYLSTTHKFQIADSRHLFD